MGSRLATFLLVLATFVFSNFARAQESKQSRPLSVSVEFSAFPSSGCSSAKGMVVHFRYDGAPPLRGYLVRVIHRDSAGRVLSEQVIQEVRNLREQMIMQGAEWTRTFCSMAGTAAGVPLAATAEVDVLRFADGSNWGPMALPASHHLIGTMDGMDFSIRPTDLERYVSPILPPDVPMPTERIQFQTIGPLRFVSGVWRDDGGQESLAVEVTNVGDAPIRGFVFTTSFFDPATGNRLRQVTTKELETRGNSKDYLLPGATWLTGARKFSNLPDGNLAGYEIILDLVVFADGSIFGPKHSSESDEVLGMFLGIDSASDASQGTFRAKKPE